MLNRLVIRHYAIIPELDILFRPGLTIITGETGAGKSILLGALGLALGKRSESRVVSDDAEKCTVEAHFQLPDNSLEKIFEREELDYDLHLICRREISQSGKSRSFINDTPVSLKTLAEITGHLLELHHQHDNLALQSREYQLNMLDTISDCNALADQYAGMFSEWNKTKRELTKTKEEEQSAVRKKEFLQFQLNELSQAKICAGEIQALEQTQLLLENAEAIENGLREVQHVLQDGPHAVLNRLIGLIKQIDSVSKFYEPLSGVGSRLEAVRVEVEDLILEANRMEGPGGNDPAKLSRTQNRLNQLYGLIKKFQVRDEEGLLGLFRELQAELSSLTSVHETIRALEDKIARLHTSLTDLAEKMRAKRKKGAASLIPKISALLIELGMPNARFEIEFKPLAEFSSTGLDEVQFIFSANKGMALQPLSAVASGGELSRLSLALKTIYAGQAHLPTIIFDEIDTGISGEVAWRMGQLILGMSKGHQTLMITHSPQIAAHAEHQFHVSKITSGQKDISQILSLTASERVREIAKMLSGDPPSKAAISNAESLIQAVKKI